MTMSLCSCGADNTDTEDVFEEEIVSYNVTTKPEDGWTWESLMPYIYINGASLEYPFTVSQLGSNYYLGDLAAGDYYLGAMVSYGMYEAFAVRYFIEAVEEAYRITADTECAGAYFSKSTNKTDVAIEELIVVNGVFIGSTVDELIEHMGEPDNIVDYEYYYRVDDCGIDFDININYVESINIYWE